MPPEAQRGEGLEPLRSRIGDAPLRVEPAGHCGVRIVLTRPEKRNAIGISVARALAELFRSLAHMDEVRIVLVAAEGDFCAGVDLEDRGGQPGDNIAQMAELFQALADLPQLSVALVSGVAFGAGLGLVVACDSAVATADAEFATPEARIGLIPSVISPYILAAVGRRAATSLFATAAPIGAERALAIGLVHAVVSDRAALEAEADRLVRAVGTAAPGAVREAKRLAEFAGRPRDQRLIAETVERTLERMASSEVREGFRAFRDRRKPTWDDSQPGAQSVR